MQLRPHGQANWSQPASYQIAPPWRLGVTRRGSCVAWVAMSKGIAEISGVDHAARLLYQAPPEEFVTQRDALVKELRAAGSKDLAVEVKALRKPSVVAAELNRIARAEPEAVAELIDAALALRAAQDEVLSGGHTDLAEPRRAYRAASAQVAGHALQHRVRVQAAIEAAAADLTQHAKLRDGTFATEPEVTIGFEVTPPGGAQDGTKERAVAPETTRKKAPTRRQLAAAVKAAEKRLDAADARLGTAHEKYESAAAAAAELDQQAASLAAELARVQRAQLKAQTMVTSAQSALDEATNAHDEASRKLISARQLLENAHSPAD